MQILDDDFRRNITSLTSTTQLRQYTLYLTVHFRIADQQGKPITKTQAVTSQRILTVNANQILGSSNEERMIQQELQHDVIQKILSVLSANQTKQALTAIKS